MYVSVCLSALGGAVTGKSGSTRQTYTRCHKRSNETIVTMNSAVTQILLLNPCSRYGYEFIFDSNSRLVPRTFSRVYWTYSFSKWQRNSTRFSVKVSHRLCEILLHFHHLCKASWVHQQWLGATLNPVNTYTQDRCAASSHGAPLFLR